MSTAQEPSETQPDPTPVPTVADLLAESAELQRRLTAHCDVLRGMGAQ